YLQHEIVLTRAGPPVIEPARAYLVGAYSPLANAAWEWDFGYGWTTVPVDQMQAFVSAQTYALRSFTAATGEQQDHWGFGWAPLTTSGTPQVAASPIAVALSSSSPAGQFSLSPTGPWSSTLTVTIPAGTNVAPPFYYQDTRAGTPTITAAAPGFTSGVQTETVQPGPPATVSVTPASATVSARGSKGFKASALDVFGNPSALPLTWSITPLSLGTV